MIISASVILFHTRKLKGVGLNYYAELQPGLFRGLPSNFEVNDYLCLIFKKFIHFIVTSME